MAYISLRKRENGSTYAYEVESYWCKKEKKPKSRQRYLGRLDDATGEIIPKRRSLEEKASDESCSEPVTVVVKVVGPSLLLDAVDERTGMRSVLKRSFPREWERLLSLSRYLTCRGEPLVYADSWLRNHDAPLSEGLASQRISELLGRMSDDSVQTFFKHWGEKIGPDECLCYDITSVSSYSEQNEYARYGHNRDGESLPQINLGMLFGEKSGLPVTYRRLPGSVNDVSALRKTLAHFEKLGFAKFHLVMDRGFCSAENVKAMCKAGYAFTIGLPSSLNLVKKTVDEVGETMQEPEGYRNVEGEVLYVHTKTLPAGEYGKRCRLHLYCNSHRAAIARDTFIEDLLRWKEELESGNRVEKNEKHYAKYFIVKETPVRGLKVSYNGEAVKERGMSRCGFFAILSSKEKDAEEALAIYRRKDVVEKCFDDLKNSLDMKRLRMHGSKTMDSRLFLQFLSLIQTSEIRNVLKESGLDKKYTVREILNEMESLTEVRHSHRYGVIRSETTKAQREILEAFGLQS